MVVSHSPIQKANMMCLSKEATNKDQTLKMQMLLSSDDKDTTNTGKIWSRNVFFGDQRGEFTIYKANFPENTLIYCNQESILTLKAGDYAFYLYYVVFGQIIPGRKSPEDIENYVCQENEVKLYMLVYNTKTGHFKGVRNWLAFTMVRGHEDETFFPYGYNEEKSKILYSSHKQVLPNIFQAISFKKHNSMFLNERGFQEFSKLFFTCHPPPTEKRKLISFLIMYNFVQLIVVMMISTDFLQKALIIDRKT